MTRQTTILGIPTRQLVLLVITALALYVVLPQLGDFRDSLSLIRNLDAAMAGVAVLWALASYAAAGGTYWLLAFKHLIYKRTVLLQLAGMFANRLLPAGLGGMGTNYRYLRTSKHTASQATAVVAINNALGLLGHMILASIIIIIFHETLPDLELKPNDTMLAATAAVLVIIATLLISQPRIRKRINSGLSQIARQIGFYRKRPGRLALAILSSMAMTMSNVLCFWFCIQAFPIEVSFVTAFMSFTFGVAVGASTPTPGGLGGVEAGMVAGLIAAGVASPPALAAVLTYRLINYWGAFAAGAVAFVYSERRGYL